MGTLRVLLASLGAAGAAASAGAALQRQVDEERAVAVLQDRLSLTAPPAAATATGPVAAAEAA